MFPTVVTTVPSRGQWLGFEHRLPGFGSCSQRYTQLHSGAGWRGVGGSGLGSSPWITTAALSHSAFPPRSPQGVQQRGPVPQVHPLQAGLCRPLPSLQGERRLILLGPLLFLFQHFSGPGPQRGAAPVSHAMALGAASRSFQILPACHPHSSQSLPILCGPRSVSGPAPC